MTPPSMLERFTDRARRVIVLAQAEARLMGHDYIGTEHLLLGLLAQPEGAGAETLMSSGISLETARGELEKVVPPRGEPPTGPIPFTPRAKKALELSLREALEVGHDHVGTGHILLGLIREGNGLAVQAIRSLAADPTQLRLRVFEAMGVEPPPARGDPGRTAGARTQPAGQQPPAQPAMEDAATGQPGCRRCGAPASAGKVQELPVRGSGSGPVPIVVAYCGRCGAVYGPVAAG